MLLITQLTLNDELKYNHIIYIIYYSIPLTGRSLTELLLEVRWNFYLIDLYINVHCYNFYYIY